MDKEQLDHLKELYRIHRSRLFVLEEKEAQYGNNTPAEIITEIRSLRQKLSDINQQLDSMRDSHEYRSGRLGIAIHLPEVSLDKWTPEIQEATIKILAVIMQITPDQIRVLNVAKGSIILLISAPMRAVESLLYLYKTKKLLAGLKIDSVRIINIDYKSLGSYSEIKSDIEKLSTELKKAGSLVSSQGGTTCLMYILFFLSITATFLVLYFNYRELFAIKSPIFLSLTASIVIISVIFLRPFHQREKLAKINLEDKRAELYMHYGYILKEKMKPHTTGLTNNTEDYVLLITVLEKGELTDLKLAKKPSYLIGSASDNDVVIDRNDIASYHVIIEIDNTKIRVTDNGSIAGTYIGKDKEILLRSKHIDLPRRDFIIWLGAAALHIIVEQVTNLVKAYA